MMHELKDGVPPAERAKEIARGVLDGGYDPLLACRDLAQLRGQLPEVSDEIMDTFDGVSSEVDELPIGSEREYWSSDTLKPKDVQATDYRERVRAVVVRALRQLLVSLDERH